MKLPGRKVGVVLTAIGLASVGALVGTANASPTAAVTKASGVAWTPCPEDPAAQCGTLRVPVDWAKPKGQTFKLALARRVATDPSRRIGVLVINPGGPGGSGVNFALGADGYFSPEVLARFDIVGFDPRGVGRSHPVKCSADLMGRAPTTSPRNQAEFAKLVAFNRKLGADCRRHTGPLIDHVDTISVVRDIDAIRAALGERTLNYHGVSYGTLMGQQYAELFGKRIRTMVIDSNMDHSLDTRGFLTTEAATAEDSFREFVAWCERDSRCLLHDRDVAKIWDGLLAKADRGELHEPGYPDLPITAKQLTATAYGAFYGPDWVGLAEMIAGLDAGRPTSSRIAATKSPTYGSADLVENSFPAVFCQDWRIQVRDYRQFAAYEKQIRRISPHMRGSILAETAVTSCLGWPTKVNNPQHRLKVRDAPKILMLNALHDPATAYEWAVNARRQLGKAAVLVTYQGWGHGVYDRSRCTRAAVDRYLLSRVVPKDGSRCAAVPPSPSALSDGTGLPVPPGPRPGVPGWIR